MTFPIPNPALDDRFAIVGTTGSGKTYLSSSAVEILMASITTPARNTLAVTLTNSPSV